MRNLFNACDGIIYFERLHKITIAPPFSIFQLMPSKMMHDRCILCMQFSKFWRFFNVNFPLLMFYGKCSLIFHHWNRAFKDEVQWIRYTDQCYNVYMYFRSMYTVYIECIENTILNRLYSKSYKWRSIAKLQLNWLILPWHETRTMELRWIFQLVWVFKNEASLLHSPFALNIGLPCARLPHQFAYTGSEKNKNIKLKWKCKTDTRYITTRLGHPIFNMHIQYTITSRRRKLDFNAIIRMENEISVCICVTICIRYN